MSAPKTLHILPHCRLIWAMMNQHTPKLAVQKYPKSITFFCGPIQFMVEWFECSVDPWRKTPKPKPPASFAISKDGERIEVTVEPQEKA